MLGAWPVIGAPSLSSGPSWGGSAGLLGKPKPLLRASRSRHYSERKYPSSHSQGCPRHAVRVGAGVRPRSKSAGFSAKTLPPPTTVCPPPHPAVSGGAARSRTVAPLPTASPAAVSWTPRLSHRPLHCPECYIPLLHSLPHLPALPLKYVRSPATSHHPRCHQPHLSHLRLSLHHLESLKTGVPASTRPHSCCHSHQSGPRSPRSGHTAPAAPSSVPIAPGTDSLPSPLWLHGLLAAPHTPQTKAFPAPGYRPQTDTGPLGLSSETRPGLPV